MRILWIVVPGTIVGVLVFESIRRVFSEDRTLVWKLIAAQPVTMVSAAAIVGSVLVWAVVEALGFW